MTLNSFILCVFFSLFSAFSFSFFNSLSNIVWFLFVRIVLPLLCVLQKSILFVLQFFSSFLFRWSHFILEVTHVPMLYFSFILLTASYSFEFFIDMWTVKRNPRNIKKIKIDESLLHKSFKCLICFLQGFEPLRGNSNV